MPLPRWTNTFDSKSNYQAFFRVGCLNRRSRSGMQVMLQADQKSGRVEGLEVDRSKAHVIGNYVNARTTRKYDPNYPERPNSINITRLSLVFFLQ